MGKPAFTNTRGGLETALKVCLIRCPLPIRIYDFDSSDSVNLGKLGEENIHKRAAFAGSVYYFRKENTKLMPGFPDNIPEIYDKKFGSIAINIFALGKIEKTLIKQNKSVFYTINGQVHGTESSAIFNKIKLGELKNNVIIEVVCDKIDKSEKTEIFMSDRERMVTDYYLTKIIQKDVQDSLKNNKKLKELQRKLKLSRSKNETETGDSASKIIKNMVNNCSEIKKIFGPGSDIQPEKDYSPKPFEGKRFPTFFNCKKNIIEIPINSYKRIIIDTDANDDYFSSEDGKFNFTNKEIKVKNSSLRNGKFTITVEPWENAKIGETKTCTFSFKDYRSNSLSKPLSCEVKMQIIPKIKKQTHKTGKIKNIQGVKTPEFKWVKKSQWDDHNFNEFSGARISEDFDGVTIYVNRNNKYLEKTLYNENKEHKTHYLNTFKVAVGTQTLALYQKLENDNGENNYEEASSAIAMTMLAVIKETGKEIFKL